jgi:hypothetical protein
MRCVRCGYCCTQLCAVIVDDPNIGIVEGNLIIHKGQGPCKHLLGDTPGEYRCAIHDKEWYPETPCSTHNSELFNDIDCKLGMHIITQYKETHS